MDEKEYNRRKADDAKWRPIADEADVHDLNEPPRSNRDKLLDALDGLMDGLEHEVGWQIGKGYREISQLVTSDVPLSRSWSWREELERILTAKESK